MPKIKDFFRKFSKHKNIAPLVPGFFKEPKKEDLSLHELGMLEQAKREYEKVLLQDKTIVSDELDFTNLFEEIRMNADLLLQDAIPTDFQQSLQRSILTSDTVQAIKLGLYYEHIRLLERQAEVLYLALKELYEKKRFLLRQSKKTAILNGMNNLKNSIILFQSQIRAMQIKIGTNLYVVEASGSLNEKEKEDVFRIAQEIISKKYQEITSQNNSVERIMAECIRELEIYVYRHKEDVALLEEQLNSLYGQIDTENPICLKDAIRKLECYFLAFAKYGKRIVDEEFMENFYRVKFEIMTMDIIEQGERDIELDTNKFEQKVYEDIVFERIEQIRNSALDPEKIADILEFLKRDDRFDVMQILTSTLHLAVLLTALDEERYNEFLDKFMLRNTWVYHSTRYFNDHLFKWANEASLRTLLITLSDSDIIYRKRILFFPAKLNGVYPIPPLIYSKKEEDKNFLLPEGLEEFHGPEVLKEHEKKLLKHMYQKMENRDVYLPKSLKVFDISCQPLIITTFRKVGEEENRIIFPNIRSLHLNQSLERFSVNVDESHRKIDELHISSTLKALYLENSFALSPKIKLEELYIEDFEHVESLFSSESFIGFFHDNAFSYEERPYLSTILQVKIKLKAIHFCMESGINISFNQSELENIYPDFTHKKFREKDPVSFDHILNYFKALVAKAREKYKEYLYSQRADLLDSSEQRKILQKQDE